MDPSKEAFCPPCGNSPDGGDANATHNDAGSGEGAPEQPSQLGGPTSMEGENGNIADLAASFGQPMSDGVPLEGQSIAARVGSMPGNASGRDLGSLSGDGRPSVSPPSERWEELSAAIHDDLLHNDGAPGKVSSEKAVSNEANVSGDAINGVATSQNGIDGASNSRAKPAVKDEPGAERAKGSEMECVAADGISATPLRGKTLPMKPNDAPVMAEKQPGGPGEEASSSVLGPSICQPIGQTRSTPTTYPQRVRSFTQELASRAQEGAQAAQSAAIADNSCAAGSREKDPPVDGVSKPPSNNVASGDAASAGATKGPGRATSLRGKVLPSLKKTFDQLEVAQKVPADGLKSSPLAPASDDEADSSTEPNPNDVYLNMKEDPEYKDLMYTEFKRLGRGSKVDENAINRVFETLKKRGGTFYQLNKGLEYVAVDDEVAKKRMRYHMSKRNGSSNDWLSHNATYNSNGVFLNMSKDPEYKDLMYAEFRKLGLGINVDEVGVSGVFQALKERGSCFYKLIPKSNAYEEVNDEGALDQIRKHFARRNKSFQHWLNDKASNYSPSDVILSLSKDAEYKTLMYAEFKRLGRGTRVDEAGVNTVFQALKKRGGRFYKVTNPNSTDHMEVDDEGALQIIRKHIAGRNKSLQDWFDEDDATKYSPNDVFLNVNKDSEYKTLMYKEFNRLGRGQTVDEDGLNAVLQALKKRGGRFFNATHLNSTNHEEVDDEGALEIIRKHIAWRNRSSQDWLEKRKYNPTDVLLSFKKDAEYKALMYAEFKKLGRGTKIDENGVNAVFQTLQKRGGRFFKSVKGRGELVEADDEGALETIRDHVKRRNQSFTQWSGNHIAPTSKAPSELTALLADGEPLAGEGSSSGRKRQKPKNFMDAQGQDMLVQETLRNQQRASKKRKTRSTNDIKPFHANENRAFELGCKRFGWGNWEQVATMVDGRTAEDVENYSFMIEKSHPEMKDRVIGEYNETWVYPGMEKLVSTSNPAHTGNPNGIETASKSRQKRKGDGASIKSEEEADAEVSKPVIEPCPELGEGWTKQIVERKGGKKKGTSDKRYYAPDGKSFRSLAKAQEYHEDDEFAARTRASIKNEEEADAEVSKPVVEPCPEIGEGWTKKLIRRKGGKNKGCIDKYYYAPDGKSFQGLTKAQKYHEDGETAAGTPASTIGKSSTKPAATKSKKKPKHDGNIGGGTNSKRSRSDKDGSMPERVTSRAKIDTGMQRNGYVERTDDGNDARRPKRQSAIKARQFLHEHADVDSDNEVNRDAAINASPGIGGDAATRTSTHGVELTAAEIAKKLKAEKEKEELLKGLTKLKAEKEELLKGLSSSPSTNGDYYEEESAWRFHDAPFPETSQEQLTHLRTGAIPGMPAPTSPDELQPLPCAPPLPKPPTTGFCQWTFDEDSRVLLANFRVNTAEPGNVEVNRDDEAFLFQMMERDDITVVSEGLADAINTSLWSRDYIEGCIGSDYHHKFRGFNAKSDSDEQTPGQPREENGWHSMKVSDYFQYLDQRKTVKRAKLDSAGERDEELGPSQDFTFIDSVGETKSVNVDQEALYMIDVDLVKLLPEAYADFQRNFKLPGILPGGSHCMMNAVNASGRPFMGPNLYITPPSSFTQFHQDGHGTVDSGHLCLSGYNEVVMLRRLTERHKHHALHLLTGTADSKSTLYGLPHRDDGGVQPGWPSKEAIERCKSMKYYPSVFILKPGQVVHINKGRLHAFRKLAPTPLQETDCHSDLREQVLKQKKDKTEDLCFSVAWDWMFKGVTSEGINREVSGILECARLNQLHSLQSLAIPETALLFLAKTNIAKNNVSYSGQSNSFFQIGRPLYTATRGDQSYPDSRTVLRGILPSLQYVVNRHNSAVKFSMAWEKKTKGVKDSWRVSIDSKPNACENPDTFTLDPYGAGDFFCKFCSEELSNVYMHCDGCEKLLDKDFNICSTCHSEGKYRITYQMHPFNDKPQSVLNHTGKKTHLSQARCRCKNGKPCAYCSYCTGCSCRCHQHFTLHYRFMGLKQELDILEQAESIVGSNVIPQTKETKARLFSLISDAVSEEIVAPAFDMGICQVIEDRGQEEAVVDMSKSEPKPSALQKEEGGAEVAAMSSVSGTKAPPKKKTAQISFRCEHCDKELSFESARAAPGAFASHVKYCRERKEKGGNDPTENDEPPVEEIHESENESMNEATRINPDELIDGARVFVKCKEGQKWKATILKRRDKDDEIGFKIHYDGQKKTVQKKSSSKNWVPISSVVGFIRECDESGEEEKFGTH